MAVATAFHDDAPATFRARANRIGLWLFIASETFLFAAIISTRYALAGTDRPEHLNQGLALAITSVLLCSSISAYMAETSIVRGDRTSFLRFTWLTIALGLMFMVGVTLEWNEGLRDFPPGTIYGSIFFTLIGLHAFHVATGLLALLVVANLGHRGHFGTGSSWGVEGCVKYWHFVDLAWVVIYPTLYLVS